ncbi:MAG: MlaC/ttg2D family ABC transporter substrate-binding protein [Rhodothermales bacterium]
MSTRLYTFALLLTFLIFSAVADPASARQAGEDQVIRSMLEQREADIKQILGDDTELSDTQMDALRAAVNDMFDFESMGREALGRHWDEISADQQQEFVEVFAEIVRYQSLADVDIYRADVTYETISVSGDEATVSTTTIYKDVPTEVDYALRRSGDVWLATDVVLDEVSTVEGYSRSFQSYVRKRGFEALMDNLNKRLERHRSES